MHTNEPVWFARPWLTARWKSLAALVAGGVLVTVAGQVWPGNAVVGAVAVLLTTLAVYVAPRNELPLRSGVSAVPLGASPGAEFPPPAPIPPEYTYPPEAERLHPPEAGA